MKVYWARALHFILLSRQIRAFNKDAIIIAQTAFGLSGDKEKVIKVGCDDDISKPINRNKLHELLIKYFVKPL